MGVAESIMNFAGNAGLQQQNYQNQSNLQSKNYDLAYQNYVKQQTYMTNAGLPSSVAAMMGTNGGGSMNSMMQAQQLASQTVQTHSMGIGDIGALGFLKQGSPLATPNETFGGYAPSAQPSNSMNFTSNWIQNSPFDDASSIGSGSGLNGQNPWGSTFGSSVPSIGEGGSGISMGSGSMGDASLLEDAVAL